MKKALISIFLVTFIIMSSSCTANHILKPNELYFADATASVFGEGKNDAKIDLTGRTVFVSDNYNETQQYVTVSIDGKEYTGKLGSVFLSPFFEDDRLIYECETDNGFLEISVNKSHGDFVGYRFITTETGEETFEKCRDAADAALQESGLDGTYIHDAFCERSGGKPDVGGKYNFYYCKIIDGIATNEMVKISVSSSTGLVTAKQIFCSHTFENEKNVAYDEKSCEELLNDYFSDFAAAYAKDSIKCDSFTVIAKYFARLADGRYGIIYHVYYKRYSGDIAPDEYSNGLKLFIELE
ncbi:MAG: hypothetical protein IJK33_01880 [Clostridia bacterium]|nr:hypothetical protein [Clostridia bacterium]